MVIVAVYRACSAKRLVLAATLGYKIVVWRAGVDEDGHYVFAVAL